MYFYLQSCKHKYLCLEYSANSIDLNICDIWSKNNDEDGEDIDNEKDEVEDVDGEGDLNTVNDRLMMMMMMMMLMVKMKLKMVKVT